MSKKGRKGGSIELRRVRYLMLMLLLRYLQSPGSLGTDSPKDGVRCTRSVENAFYANDRVLEDLSLFIARNRMAVRVAIIVSPSASSSAIIVALD